MSDDVKVDGEIEFDPAGVGAAGDGISVHIDWSMFEKLADEAGFVPQDHLYDLERQITIAGECLLEQVPDPEDDGLSPVDTGFSEMMHDVRVENKRDLVVGIVTEGWRGVGIVNSASSYPLEQNQFAQIHNHSARVELLADTVGLDSVAIGARETYENGNRDYPGYHAVEDHHVAFPDGTTEPLLHVKVFR